MGDGGKVREDTKEKGESGDFQGDGAWVVHLSGAEGKAQLLASPPTGLAPGAQAGPSGGCLNLSPRPHGVGVRPHHLLPCPCPGSERPGLQLESPGEEGRGQPGCCRGSGAAGGYLVASREDCQGQAG